MSHIKLPGRIGFMGPRLLGRNSSDWNEWTLGFAAHGEYSDNEPAAIAVCRAAADVKIALRWARERGMPVRVRGGRHHYEGWSSCVKDGCIIDISRIKTFVVDDIEGRAVLGAGLTMFELTEGLNRYGLGMPYATSSSVGLAGFLLGGGLGVTSRLWGLGSDHVTAFRMVDAAGKARWIRPDTDTDLFFACLGSGGSGFGIVTEFEVTLHKVKRASIVEAHWDWERFEDVVDTWQRNGPDSDAHLTTFLTFGADRSIRLEGQFTGVSYAEKDVREALDSVSPIESSTSLQISALPYAATTRAFLKVSDESPQGWHHSIKQQYFKSTSAYARNILPSEALKMLKHKLQDHPSLREAAPETSVVRLVCGGGAVAAPGRYSTATSQRDSLFLLQYNGYWTAPQDRHAVQNWACDLRACLLPWTTGAYIGYVDDAIPVQERATTYFGTDAPLLAEIKAESDPNGLFLHPCGLL